MYAGRGGGGWRRRPVREDEWGGAFQHPGAQLKPGHVFSASVYEWLCEAELLCSFLSQQPRATTAERRSRAWLSGQVGGTDRGGGCGAVYGYTGTL